MGAALGAFLAADVLAAQDLSVALLAADVGAYMVADVGALQRLCVAALVVHMGAGRALAALAVAAALVMNVAAEIFVLGRREVLGENIRGQHGAEQRQYKGDTQDLSVAGLQPGRFVFSVHVQTSLQTFSDL